jgi:hypothetical protein
MTKEYLNRGFTITGQSETAVNLVKEDRFHLWRMLIRAVFFYPLLYGARPRDDVYLSVDGNQVMRGYPRAGPAAGSCCRLASFLGSTPCWG